MTTQSASRGGETHVVVGDKIGCSQSSIYSSAFTELADAAGPTRFFGMSISSLKAPSSRIEFPLDHKIEIRAPDKIRRSELSYQCRSPVILTTIVRDQAAFLGAAPDLDAGPALISIVLVVFIALAGFLIVRCSTPLSKWASTAPSSGSNGRDIDR